MQRFSDPSGGSANMILGAMGSLQLDVLSHRLATEYKVKLKLVPLAFSVARWVQGEFDLSPFRYTETVRVVEDRERRPVLLFASAWTLESTLQRHSDLQLSETADPRQFASVS